MDDLKAIIGKIATGAALSRDEAASAFDRMMSGEATPSQMGALLMGLRVRGETSAALCNEEPEDGSLSGAFSYAKNKLGSLFP